MFNKDSYTEDFLNKFDHNILYKCLRSRKSKENNKDIISQLENFYYWCTSYREIHYLYTNRIVDPINYCNCYECNNLTNYRNNGNYNKYCSILCSSKSVSSETKSKRLNSYKNTMKEKYGVENYYSSEEFKIYMDNNPQFEYKRIRNLKESFKQKYGVESPFEVKEIKEKAENTIEERYGNKSFFGSKNIKKI